MVLGELGRLEDAAAAYLRALETRPDRADVWNNLGNLRRRQGRLADAEACYISGIASRPDAADLHTHLAMLLLHRGDFTAGWAAYEWRWRSTLLDGGRPDIAAPLWCGGTLDGKTLLIHAEQGFGDTLQFCRYVPLAAARGARVILAVPAPLVRLLGNLPGASLVVDQQDPWPLCDLHCPMLSLPLAFGTTLATIPQSGTYLQAGAETARAWHSRLEQTSGRHRRIGLVWAGNPRRDVPALAAIDRRRSLNPETLAPLFDVPGVRYFSLQKDGPRAPEHFPMIDFMDEMSDFADTSGLLANLDLVISVDTAVAHLAAAMGKPVWLLDRFDPCWRWLADRRDSPWYPTLRIYRQTSPDDWASVIADAARDLARYTS